MACLWCVLWGVWLVCRVCGLLLGVALCVVRCVLSVVYVLLIDVRCLGVGCVCCVVDC